MLDAVYTYSYIRYILLSLFTTVIQNTCVKIIAIRYAQKIISIDAVSSLLQRHQASRNISTKLFQSTQHEIYFSLFGTKLLKVVSSNVRGPLQPKDVFHRPKLPKSANAWWFECDPPRCGCCCWCCCGDRCSCCSCFA